MEKKHLGTLLLLPLMISAEAFAAYSDDGRWSPVIKLDLVPVAVSNLPDGKVLAWSAKDKFGFGGNTGKTWTTIFDPQNRTYSTTLVAESQHDMFCPGISNLADGRVMVTGGSGNDKTSIYNPATGTWTAAAKLNTPRGYNSQLTLNDGSVFTLGGSWGGTPGEKNAEVWAPASGWIPYPYITSFATVRDGSGGGPLRSDIHGWLWAAPNGKVFHAGPSSNMHWIDVKGLGRVTSAGPRGTDPYSMTGTTVMYEPGMLLKAGGSATLSPDQKTSDRVQIIDIRTDTAVVTEVESLKYSRTLHHSVVLPTGKVFVVGGRNEPGYFSDLGARLIPELFDPATGSWTSLARMATARTYHSVALLMNDARVLVGGGGLCGGRTGCVNHPDVELFSPPYLYVEGTNTLASRPVIKTAPSKASYNASVNVSTNSSVESFVLVRSSSATHSLNNEQRRIPLTHTGSGNNYTLKMPSRNNAPPGDYMLFAINAMGTPSIAKVVRLGKMHVVQELANGEYWFTAPDSGQRLAAPASAGYKSKMYNANGNDNQKWRIQYRRDHMYTIQNVASGRFMEIENGSCANRTQISGSTKANAIRHHWIISKVGENYQLRSPQCIKKGLDHGGPNGTLYDFAPNRGSQRWALKSTVAVVETAAPIGNPDEVTVVQGTEITIDALANDTGTGITLNAPNVWSLKGGSVALANGKLVYRSSSVFAGTDKIWYVLTDTKGRESSSVITITVTGDNTVVADVYPTASEDNVEVTANTSITIDALANDTGNGLVLDSPNAWSLKGGSVGLSDNKITYQSKPGFTGTDTIWYTFKDFQERGNNGQINITVTGGEGGPVVVDFYPIANPDNFTTSLNTAQTLDILANDSASDGIAIDTLYAYSAKGGTTTKTADNKVLYTPKADFTGEDNFWYVMSDSQGRTNSSQVKINVTP